ncbi:adenylate/guanylate cyclase domain-containing protein, partial [Acinetobacter baumannii]
APLDDPQHARMACLTVLRMRERLTSLQEELNPILKEAADARARALGRPVPVPKLAIGMGVNTGECVVGNMGSHQKTNYSVLGDTVNLASRLEGQTK